MLPNKDGFAIADEIREINEEVPIIFLTAKVQTEDVVKGFTIGGNDYIRKPFSMEELIVRIMALLSRNGLIIKDRQIARITKLGEYRFEYPNGILSFFENRRTLTTRESEILQMLLINKNQAVDRKSILLSFWGNDDYFSGRSLDVFIAKLRRYLKEDPSVAILNIRGQGYKLIY